MPSDKAFIQLVRISLYSVAEAFPLAYFSLVNWNEASAVWMADWLLLYLLSEARAL